MGGRSGLDLCRRILISLLLLLAGASPAVGQGDKLSDALARYHALIAAYRAGDRTVPQQVLSIDRQLFRSMLGALATNLDTVHPWESGRFTTAAFMHTEAAFLQHRYTSDRTFEQLDIASQILAKGGPEIRDTSSRWYVAVARVLRDRMRFEDAERLLELGRARLRDDAAVLCESGTLEEYLATDARYPPNIRSALRGGSLAFSVWPRREAAVMQRRERRLERAATFLQASASRTMDAVCGLHLGRVSLLRGDNDVAERYLRPLVESDDAAISYLASLFLGAGAERRSEFAEAGARYRDAIARVPRAHAAYFGLSSVLYRQGDAHGARAALTGAILPDDNNRRDPFWWYFVEPGSVATQRLQALRKEVVK